MADDDETVQADLVAAEAELHQQIAQVLGQQGLMVTKWLLSVEFLDSDGGRGMQALTSPDFRSWDSLGFLGYLDARERGVVGATAAHEFLDDEPDGGG